jgi:hypothetical protein
MPSASSALPRPRWGRRLAAATAAAAIALAGTLASELPAHAAPTPFSAGMETGNLREFTATSVSSGALQVTTQRAFSGSRSAHATYTGRGSNGYARGQQDVTWRSGDDVWYGMAVFLPSGFKAAQQGPVDLLRWDNWSIDPNNTDRSGLTLDSRGRLVLLTQQLNRTGYNPLLGGYDVPEGRWVHLEVRQRLSSSSGQAINEVWMDGRRLGSNTSANSYGRNATRLRAGIVAVSAGQQTNNLQLWFDDVTISSSRVGPKGSTSSPSPSPAPSTGFTDVVAGSTHAANISTIARKGITHGCGNGRYCPSRGVTRAEMASFLTRALDLPARSGSRYRDVKAGSTHAGAIEAIAAAGITQGCGNDRFCPDRVVTRAEMATFLVRSTSLSPRTSGSRFVDVRAGATHTGSINAIADAGITTGCGRSTHYCPDRGVTRAEMASFLVRAFRL